METNTFIETLKKVNREPGLCTSSEIFAAQKFYRNLDKTLKVYEAVNNHNPFGHTVESKLDELKFYIDKANQETSSNSSTEEGTE